MRAISIRILGVALACAAGLGGGRPAEAQLFGGGIPILAPDPTIAPMQSLSQYQLGEPGAGANLATAAAGVPIQGNFMNSPMGSAMVYGTMMGNPSAFGVPSAMATSSSTAATTAAATNLQTAQLGMMWMMANQQNSAPGSSRMSVSPSSGATQAAPDDRIRSRVTVQTRNRPGGLSARYFSRSATRATYPRRYFDRRPSSFP